MPLSFNQLRDGTIRIITYEATYDMSQEEFVTAFGQPVPELIPPITQRTYEPGIRHPLSVDNDVRDGGPIPWPEGDDILARADDLFRPTPKPVDDTPERLNAFLAAENTRLRQEEDVRIAAYMVKRAKGIEIITSILKRAGGTDEELSQIVDGLWPPPGTREENPKGFIP